MTSMPSREFFLYLLIFIAFSITTHFSSSFSLNSNFLILHKFSSLLMFYVFPISQSTLSQSLLFSITISSVPFSPIHHYPPSLSLASYLLTSACFHVLYYQSHMSTTLLTPIITRPFIPAPLAHYPLYSGLC